MVLQKFYVSRVLSRLNTDERSLQSRQNWAFSKKKFSTFARMKSLFLCYSLWNFYISEYYENSLILEDEQLIKIKSNWDDANGKRGLLFVSAG